MTTLYPSANEWDVPDLLPSLQADVVPPVVPWGSVARTTFMPGTWTFYVDDYRFRALFTDPLQLVATGCSAAVELNPTLREESPAAEVLWATFRKRATARAWQAAGIRVFVDLNVPGRYLDLSMLGVPKGWRSFATRGYAARPDALQREHAFARAWAGDSLTMLVYGGGAPVQRLCRELPGTVWVPSAADERRGLQGARLTADPAMEEPTG